MLVYLVINCFVDMGSVWVRSHCSGMLHCCNDVHCCTIALLHCKVVTLIDDEDDVSSVCWQFEVIHCPDLACTVMILSANQAVDFFL